MDRKNEFANQIKQRDLKLFPLFIILFIKKRYVGKSLNCAMQCKPSLKVNAIKGGQKFLLHRKFQDFLEEYNVVYTDIPLYCEIRWISAGKCLEKFFAIKKRSSFSCKICLIPNLTNLNLFLKIQTLRARFSHRFNKSLK